MYSKQCTTEGCGFPFTSTTKHHKDATAICPSCGAEVKVGDAKPLTQAPNPPAATAQ